MLNELSEFSKRELRQFLDSTVITLRNFDGQQGSVLEKNAFDDGTALLLVDEKLPAEDRIRAVLFEYLMDKLNCRQGVSIGDMVEKILGILSDGEVEELRKSIG